MHSVRHRLSGVVAAGAVALVWATSVLGVAGPSGPKTDEPAARPAPPRARPPSRRQRTPQRRSYRRSRRPQPYSKNHSSTRAAFAPIVARAGASTVAIYCNGKQVALGAVVDAAGYVVTKASEVSGAPQCRSGDGRTVPARIVARDDRNDVALLKVSHKGFKPLQWADDDNPPVGSWIITPGLTDVPVSIGVVSVARRKGSTSRRPGQGFLGISFPRTGNEARVGQVIPQTAAARAALKANDLIVKVDSRAVKDRNELLALLGRTKPRQKVKLRIKRGDSQFDVTATLGLYPARGLGPQQYAGGALSERRTGFESIIQHDSTLRPDQCGGPAVNTDGKTVGINISRAGRVESYILPASVARKLIARLKLKGAQTTGPAESGKSK